jgi:hypothetical protein
MRNVLHSLRGVSAYPSAVHTHVWHTCERHTRVVCRAVHATLSDYATVAVCCNSACVMCPSGDMRDVTCHPRNPTPALLLLRVATSRASRSRVVNMYTDGVHVHVWRTREWRTRVVCFVVPATPRVVRCVVLNTSRRLSSYTSDVHILVWCIREWRILVAPH